MSIKKNKLKEVEQNVKLKNNLNKENYLIKEMKSNKITKKELNEIKKNPKEYINSLTDNNLIKLIQGLNYSYYIEGISLISDDLYDYIKEELNKRLPNHPLMTDIGVSNISKEKLPYYMGSMDKIKSDENVLNRWIKKYPGKNGYILSDKLDGISGLYTKKDNRYSLYTRGDGNTGQDVSYLLNFINGIPELDNIKYKEFAVRGEFIITKKNFLKIKKNNKDVKNVRNMVAGIFNSKKPNLEISKYIDFVAYECIIPDKLEPQKQFKLLNELDFNVVFNKKIDKIDILILSKILENRRQKSEYDIDGLIVSENEKYDRIISGNPNYSFAFKDIFTLKKAEVMVLEVKWSITKDKYIQPIVLFKPIELNGVVIEKATGFNGKFIKDNKIGPGSKIIIVRRGDVIPHIEEVLKSSETGEPSMPNYKYKWNPTEVELILDEEENRQDIIREQKIKELENFITKIKFDKISIGLVKKLYNSGIDSIYKFLNITKNQLLEIDGIKEKTAENILNSIKKSMKDIDCLKLMVASNSFGRGFGEKTFKLIYNSLDRDIIKEKPTLDELTNIKGIEIKTANKFIDNFDKFINFLKENKLECNFNKKEKFNNKLKNMNIVFSGIRDNELEENIENLGGNIKSTVSKETNVLIIKNSDSTSSKIKKAKELDINIMNIENFKNKYLK